MLLVEEVFISKQYGFPLVIVSLLGIYENKEEAIEKAKGEKFLSKNETEYIFLIDTREFISNKLATGPAYIDEDGTFIRGYRTIREVNYGKTTNLLSRVSGEYVNVITDLEDLKQQLLISIFTRDKNDVKLIKLALLNKDVYHEVESNKLCPNEEDCNIDTRSKKSTSTALIISCAHNNIKNVETLLKNGAYIDHPNNNNMKALAVAALNNNVEIVKLLLEYKPDIKIDCYNSWTAKMFTTDPQIKKLLSF